MFDLTFLGVMVIFIGLDGVQAVEVKAGVGGVKLTVGDSSHGDLDGGVDMLRFLSCLVVRMVKVLFAAF